MVKNEYEEVKILPVTKKIREYLKKTENNKIKIKDFFEKYNFSKEKCDITIDNNNNIIIKTKQHTEENLAEKIKNKELFLRDIAKKLDKSLIWVYQEMVLNDLGNQINPNSEIYKVSEIALKDIQIIQEKGTEEEIVWYENNCILTGEMYEIMYILNNISNTTTNRYKNIIPITSKVRNYLLNQENKRVIPDWKALESGDNYQIDKRKKEAENKLKELKKQASLQNKSLIWNYQEMVVNGFSEYIDINSDIYKATALAYHDIINIINTKGQEEANWYEDCCVLTGHIYDEVIEKNKNISKRTRKLIKE